MRILDETILRPNLKPSGFSQRWLLQPIDLAPAFLLVCWIDDLHLVDDCKSAEFIGFEKIREPGLDSPTRQAAIIDGEKLDQFLTAKDRHPHLDKIDNPVVPSRSGRVRDPV